MIENIVQVNAVRYTSAMVGVVHTRHDRAAVVAAALRQLDENGLPDLTMRRLAAALDVQPSALYHHFPNKQTLLAAVSDRILAGARRPSDPGLDWRRAVELECLAIRDALLAYRDGAELVVSTRALGLGGDEALTRIRAALERTHPPSVAADAATALLHLVLGDASLAQQRLQAEALGLELPASGDGVMPTGDRVFRAGVRLLLDGVEHASEGARDGADAPDPVPSLDEAT